MRKSLLQHIIGCFLLAIFLVSTTLPALLQVSGHWGIVTYELMAETEQELMKESGKTEYECIHDGSFFIHPPVFYSSYHYNIPRTLGFIQAVALPVPTPPPDGVGA